ncbi:alpha/beta hydrolase [Persicimonas caeni]|uniref:Alpha/beta hydrolase n=1 Tax=Persicimonas caeni TaxID=2292766 RepID=A0A4Y6PQH1_PERCE|nr:alpha/beta hydrolase [Persicimonas caeni]QDG50267.1 alpha/beta hydrolase [Persicimonas caeni]QED31488.1 alpha/beta hydrolase [Persicimonas caeni]
MNVTELGMGPTLVLLHGDASPERVEPLARALADEFRVLLPDISEYCASGPLDPDGRRRCREALEEMIDQWTDVAQVSIVGHADGCYRAFDLALAGRVSIGAIVALGPFDAPDEDEAERFEHFVEQLGRITAPVYLRTAGDDQPTATLLAHQLQRYLSNATLDDVDADDLLAGDALDDTAEAISDFFLGARRTDVLELADVLAYEEELD